MLDVFQGTVFRGIKIIFMTVATLLCFILEMKFNKLDWYKIFSNILK